MYAAVVAHLQILHRLFFHVLQKHSHSQKALKPDCYYAGRQLRGTDLEAQKFHCCSATMQTLLYMYLGGGARRVEGSCCFFQHIRGICESYHHMLLVLLSSLLLRKREGKAGTRQDKSSRLICLLSLPLTLEEFLPWVAGWHSCPKQAAMYTGAHSVFGLLGYLVLSRKGFCQDAIIMHLPRSFLLSSRI